MDKERIKVTLGFGLMIVILFGFVVVTLNI